MTTLKELNKALNAAEIDAREILIHNLRDEEFIRIAQEGDAFHELLVRAQYNGWVHYTRLADILGLSASQVNRWFKPADEASAASRSTPNKFTIAAALKALIEILQVDIHLLRDGEKPIGGHGINRAL
ncbi:MAG: hypothetical protein WDM79_18715 [Terricaulis sp.]